jgi:hypothetical protein
MAAPVPAPNAPVLTARHPGVTPQPPSANAIMAVITQATVRGIFSSRPLPPLGATRRERCIAVTVPNFSLMRVEKLGNVFF